MLRAPIDTRPDKQPTDKHSQRTIQPIERECSLRHWWSPPTEIAVFKSAHLCQTVQSCRLPPVGRLRGRSVEHQNATQFNHIDHSKHDQSTMTVSGKGPSMMMCAEVEHVGGFDSLDDDAAACICARAARCRR